MLVGTETPALRAWNAGVLCGMLLARSTDWSPANRMCAAHRPVLVNLFTGR